MSMILGGDDDDEFNFSLSQRVEFEVNQEKSRIYDQAFKNGYNSRARMEDAEISNLSDMLCRLCEELQLRGFGLGYGLKDSNNADIWEWWQSQKEKK